MNAFFDEYVSSKTSLKQFVEQYERALRSKVEKEFQVDFRLYSAMIPCLTTYGLEKQMQQVYTIAKFKEVQTELIGMMFCNVLSWDDEFTGTRYVVREDVVVSESTKRKKFTVVYVKDQCQIVRYDQLFKTFGKVANLVVDDDVRTKELMEFLENYMNEIVISKPSMTCQDSNFLSQNSVQLASDSREVEITHMVPILYPTCKKTKGTPRKIRKKGPLEKNTKKTNVISKLSKGKRPSQHNEHESHGTIQPSTFTYSHMLMGSQFQHWEGALGMPTYALQWQLQDKEAVGLNSIQRN
ncbi:Protein FAR1-RELATED SEQUENCE [Abeliophyllum distichum]|uniref:Protein FAR1-RELATED SEQUENCE n=1 Tax=Abeliophyllum distichum TaxID=126358 RepID=A0ABD1R9M9_9LAMI